MHKWPQNTHWMECVCLVVTIRCQVFPPPLRHHASFFMGTSPNVNSMYFDFTYQCHLDVLHTILSLPHLYPAHTHTHTHTFCPYMASYDGNITFANTPLPVALSECRNRDIDIQSVNAFSHFLVLLSSLLAKHRVHVTDCPWVVDGVNSG